MFSRLKKKIRLRKQNNSLIHIGKCGGSSLRNAIKTSCLVNIKEVIHITKPAYVTGKSYYIVARDPVSRCISAFNWRYKLVVEDQSQKNRFKGEYKILSKYEELNKLAEKLYSTVGELESSVASDFEGIHHFHERISFYLKDFLLECPPENIKGVFMQETLNADIERYLGVLSKDVGSKKLNKRSKGNDLSLLGERNLKRYLQDDYNCLISLYHLGHIKKEVIQEILGNLKVNEP